MQIDEIDEVPVVEIRNAKLPPLQSAAKRILDVVVSLILLIILAVPMLLLAWLIKLQSPGPAFFVQKRVGLHGKLFNMLKFRTMNVDSEQYAPAPTSATDPRITPSGQWLRKFSIDEFPQLINVLRGDMSMVGPRPEMPFLVEKYQAWERRRLDVKPGITGLWQIVGRKNLPLSLNMEYDFYYIKNQSLLFDIIILIKTIPAVVFGKGAF
jgi:exopolysaccharide biosynthesis polyprenyl glycosylphosphotransferase